jgi:hypothetical protein
MNPLTHIKNTQKITKREIELGLFEKVKGSLCSEQPASRPVTTRFALLTNCFFSFTPNMVRLMQHVASTTATAAPPVALLLVLSCCCL